MEHMHVNMHGGCVCLYAKVHILCGTCDILFWVECVLISHGFVCCQDETGTVPSIGGGCGTLCIEHTTAFFGGGTVLVFLLHKPGEHMVRRMECGA